MWTIILILSKLSFGLDEQREHNVDLFVQLTNSHLFDMRIELFLFLFLFSSSIVCRYYRCARCFICFSQNWFDEKKIDEEKRKRIILTSTQLEQTEFFKIVKRSSSTLRIFLFYTMTSPKSVNRFSKTSFSKCFFMDLICLLVRIRH